MAKTFLQLLMSWYPEIITYPFRFISHGFVMASFDDRYLEQPHSQRGSARLYRMTVLLLAEHADSRHGYSFNEQAWYYYCVSTCIMTFASATYLQIIAFHRQAIMKFPVYYQSATTMICYFDMPSSIDICWVTITRTKFTAFDQLFLGVPYYH